MSQRQPSLSNSAILKHGGLAALLRQASSPAVQRPEGAATVMPRQGGKDMRDSVPHQNRSPDVQRADSSAAAIQRQGSRAIRGTSPALQRPGSLPSPVVAADFARKGSNGLSAFPSGELAGRSERVCYFLLCYIDYTMSLCKLLLDQATCCTSHCSSMLIEGNQLVAKANDLLDMHMQDPCS